MVLKKTFIKNNEKSSLVTKKGDKGTTELYCRKKVLKDDVRCEACGTLDELCSFLGLLKVYIKEKNMKSFIEHIQKDLFIIGTEIVTTPKKVKLLKKRIGKTHVVFFERRIKDLEKKIILPSKFILPGKNKISVFFHITRAVTRRLERRVVALKKKKLLKNNFILTYLNRLSDILYILAYWYEK